MKNRSLRFQVLRRPTKSLIRTARGHLCPWKPAFSLYCEPVWSVDRYTPHRDLACRCRRCATGVRSGPRNVECGVLANAPLSVPMRTEGREWKQAAAVTIKGNRALVGDKLLVSLNFLRDSSRLAVSGWSEASPQQRVCVGELSASPDRCITAQGCGCFGHEFWCQAEASSTAANLGSIGTPRGRQGPQQGNRYVSATLMAATIAVAELCIVRVRKDHVPAQLQAIRFARKA